MAARPRVTFGTPTVQKTPVQGIVRAVFLDDEPAGSLIHQGANRFFFFQRVGSVPPFLLRRAFSLTGAERQITQMLTERER